MYFKRLLPFGFQHVKCRNLKISGGYFSKLFSKQFSQRSKFPDVGKDSKLCKMSFASSHTRLVRAEQSRSATAVKPVSTHTSFPGKPYVQMFIGMLVLAGVEPRFRYKVSTTALSPINNT